MLTFTCGLNVALATALALPAYSLDMARVLGGGGARADAGRL